MKKVLIYVAGTTILPVVIIIVLSWNDLSSGTSEFHRKTKLIGSIKQVLQTGSFKSITYSELNLLYLYIDSPASVLVTDTNLNVIEQKQLNIKGRAKHSFACFLPANSVYIIQANSRRAELFTDQFQFKDTIRLNRDLFTRAIFIDSNTYVLRGFDNSISKHDQLFLFGRFGNGIIKREVDVSERNQDAGLATDGILNFDRKNNYIIYQLFFKDEFWVMDTNLHLKYKALTVHVPEQHLIQAGAVSIGRGKKYTHLKPPKMINYQSCIFNGELYINSWVSDKQGTAGLLKHYSIIDQYDLLTGNYVSSTLIPFYHNQSLKRFAVTSSSIVVVYDSAVVSYQR